MTSPETPALTDAARLASVTRNVDGTATGEVTSAEAALLAAGHATAEGRAGTAATPGSFTFGTWRVLVLASGCPGTE